MVIGNRMKNIQPGAMPWHHRYIGNPLLSGLAQLLLPYRSPRRPLRHARGPPRLLWRGSICARPGWSSPRRWSCARPGADLVDRGRSRSHISRGGGIEALELPRRMAASSLPARQFARSSVYLAGSGARSAGAAVSPTVLARVPVFQRQWDLHALIGGSLLLIIGAQLVGLGLCAHAYATTSRLMRDRWFDRARARADSSTGSHWVRRLRSPAW